MMHQELKQDIVFSLSKERKYGFRPVVCNHPECPYKDCRFNQCYITLDDLDKDIWYIDMKCEKYLDI
jgi:hypothetical protein